MAKLPWFPFYVADFWGDEDVLAMNFEEVGLYLKLLCHQWREGSIPADEERIANISQCDRQAITRLWPGVRGCFSIDPDDESRLFNQRLSDIECEQKKRHKQFSEAGSKGNEKRWGGGSPGDRPPIATEQNRVDKIKNKTTTTAPGGAAPQDGIATVLPLAENTPAPPNGGTPTELVASDPKPPAENASPVHVLSWNIFEGRKHLYDDQFYDPWNRKALGICKTLIEKKARGDFTEVLKRLRVLFVKCASAPPGSDYWAFTPENFTSKWSQLVDDPRLRIEKPSREALARAGYEERIRALTQEMRDETT